MTKESSVPGDHQVETIESIYLSLLARAIVQTYGTDYESLLEKMKEGLAQNMTLGIIAEPATTGFFRLHARFENDLAIFASAALQQRS